MVEVAARAGGLRSAAPQDEELFRGETVLPILLVRRSGAGRGIASGALDFSFFLHRFSLFIDAHAGDL